jgi:phospholipase C
MRTRTSLWLLATTFTVAGCSSASGPAADPSTAGEQAPLRAGTTYAGGGDNTTTSPIKHLIVIIGENRTFDHVFATYKPQKGQTVNNLLSQGIINEDGTPGPNYARAIQYTAIDGNPPPAVEPLSAPLPSTYQVAPGGKTPYTTLPPPALGGPVAAEFTTVAAAEASENGLPDLADGGGPDPAYYAELTTGGTGIMGSHIPDSRVPSATDLPPGPFQLTPGVPYDSYAASPVHRFYQMWQQLDCSADYATATNPSGCLNDLFPWVETTIGAGSNTRAQPANFTNLSTGEGSTAMGFYNVLEGDAPYFKSIADTYAMSDNFHQSVQGGTGANHIMMGFGDAIYYTDGNGTALPPPAAEIENPDPQPGTNNYYTDDGYGTSTTTDGGVMPLGGGSYSNCSDSDQPGVASVNTYLSSLPVPIAPHCDPGHYYLLNNYNPGYLGDGTPVNLANIANTFTIPPSGVPTIGDPLRSKDVSFAFFGDQFNQYVIDPNSYDTTTNEYCSICNFFQFSTGIMGNPAARAAHMKDTIDLYNGLAAGQLPAVSFVKPSGLLDGHPASSKLDLFEGFVKKIADLVQSQPALWQDTAIVVTFDEGGGYYDSGYVQPLDFFGDGTRIPTLVISPLATGGRISHEYTDHVSIMKFIERNWGLNKISKRSRDNMPNPIQTGANPYAPTNSPAIGDMFDLFDFSHKH